MRAIFLAVVVCQALQQVHCQGSVFPPFRRAFPGSFGALGPVGGFGNQVHQQQQKDVLSCVRTNPQDPSSLIRLTISDEQQDAYQNPLLFGRQLQNDDMPGDWAINGYIKLSSAVPVTGSFQVVVTQYGRVSDGCNAAAMGPAITSQSLFGQSPFGNSPFGQSPFGNSPFGQSPFMNPFFNFGNLGGLQRPAGHLTNPLLASQGGMTIYSARLQHVSRNQLMGGGIAVCPQVGNKGECYGSVVLCCTIAKDQLPASEVYVQTSQQNLNGAMGFPGQINNFPVGNGFAAGSSIPFEMEPGNVLSFTDPNALAASNKANSRDQTPAESSGTSNTAGLF